MEIVSAVSSAEIINKEDLSYDLLLAYLTNSATIKNNKGILDEFRVGEALSFNRVDKVEGLLDFTLRGDILSFWLPGYSEPVRADFFGDECEALYFFDSLTGKKTEDLDSLVLVHSIPSNKSDLDEIKVAIGQEPRAKSNNKTAPSSKLQAQSFEKIIFTNKYVQGIEHLTDDIELTNSDYAYPQLFFGNLDVLTLEIQNLERNGYTVLINSLKSKELPEILSKYFVEDKTYKGFASESLKNLPAGFISASEKFVLFTDREIFGTIVLKNNENAAKLDTNFKKLLREFEGEIEIDSYVVHEDYGIGIYKGLQQEEIDGAPSDYLLLEFANDDELFVPISQLQKITKYLGNDGIEPKLTSLGKGKWEELKKKVRAKTYLTAKELISHMAKREVSNADPVHNTDSDAYKKFVSEFPYKETPDQIRSINEIVFDLEQKKPMNRLLVGDVGYGKTEVIIRAAFKIVENGGQVAFLAPTTVLVAQHEQVLKERFKNTGITIDAVSRFKSVAENKKIIDRTNEGKVDILIGTHRLLSSDVKFDNLQLMVVDEEQKFGVKQKEKIKQINYGAHVLMVSATPIPRSLSMALSSIQDISIITTPPPGRKSVETEIIFNDWIKSANAIQKEISRGGQVYFIHNRVETIQGIVTKLKELLPEISIEFAHGQLAPNTLDRLITDFFLKKFDVLVSTSIIENGLDLPNVNTIVIHDAHRMGLSQLYQMRGRVGRSDKQAYCYIMAPDPKQKLEKELTTLTQEEIYAHIQGKKKLKKKVSTYMDRLQTLVDNQDLGSGFRVASRDLEIRGAGSLLGDRQHGHIESVGYALFIEMLADAVKQVKGEEN